MEPFSYVRAGELADAISEVARGARPLGGGTTLLDLMKLGVVRPQRLVDIGHLQQGPAVAVERGGLRLSAFARMSEVASDPVVRRDYPVLAEALEAGASGQIRNMARLGGNVLQATRCSYFRDVSVVACNKRAPGSGCAALEGANRHHAVLGGSPSCIATYPGDFAQALVTLDANVEAVGRQGARTFAFADLHRLPGDTPHFETQLRPDELILGFVVPAGPWTRRSRYLKVRDRASYAFALASAAVALEIEDGVVRTARIGLGGVATRPWRAPAAERRLVGARLDAASAQAAAEAAFAEAQPRGDNAFKIELGRRTLVRALLEAGRRDV